MSKSYKEKGSYLKMQKTKKKSKAVKLYFNQEALLA